MWELDYKESWAPKNWCFWTVVLEKTLKSLDPQKSPQTNSLLNNPQHTCTHTLWKKSAVNTMQLITEKHPYSLCSSTKPTELALSWLQGTSEHVCKNANTEGGMNFWFSERREVRRWQWVRGWVGKPCRQQGQLCACPSGLPGLREIQPLILQVFIKQRYLK